ncbi:MAG: pyridoxal phosphate-dependent aminotransferase [Acidiferrobacterales bacterium]
MTQRARELKQAGKDVIGLGAGEPDFDTPDHIKEAAIAAIRAGFTHYTAVDGTSELKQAIINKFKRDNDLEFEPDQIIVSVGGKQSFFNIAQALLQAGDEAIIPAPYWVSYPDIALLADAEPVIIMAGIDQDFKVTPEQLDEALNKNTRLLILNSPSNPTGVIYTREDLAGLGEVLRGYPDVYIATDDMYEHIRWTDQPFYNIVNACPDLLQRTIVVNGVSKAYAMTGWRIGFAAGPKPVIAAMRKIQSQSTSNPTSISQVAAEAALSGDQECLRPMVAAFKERHDRVVGRLNQIRGVNCLQSQGAFYAFADMREAIADLADVNDDVEMAEYLLNAAGVALVPGSAFGGPGYLRLSFATSMEVLDEALDRIERVLGRREDERQRVTSGPK